MCWQAGWAGLVRVLSTSNNSSRLHGLQHVPTWLLMNSDSMTVTGALKRHLGQHTVHPPDRLAVQLHCFVMGPLQPFSDIKIIPENFTAIRQRSW